MQPLRLHFYIVMRYGSEPKLASPKKNKEQPFLITLYFYFIIQK